MFDGAVYTTKHGPQPTSEGCAYYQNDDSDKWLLLKDGKEIEAKVIYQGHYFKKGQVQINFELITPEGDRIGVSEIPEYNGL